MRFSQPNHCQDFFALHKWNVLDAPNWVEAAVELGLRPEQEGERQQAVTSRAEMRAQSAYLVATLRDSVSA